MTPTYTIRIIHPANIVHTFETRSTPHLEEAGLLAQQVGDKLLRNGVKEYEIHILDTATGTPIRTLTRRVEEVPVYENR